MRLDEVLDRIGGTAHTVAHDSTVDDAVRLMAEQKARALIVMNGEEPVGIFTEGDLVRTHVKCGGRPLTDVGMREVMSDNLITAEIENETGECIGTMLGKGIGCLPIAREGRIAGMLYLRDLLRHEIEWLTAELSTLHEYLADLQDAVVD